MKDKVDRHNLAVIVARFQVPNLTEAHIELIEEALSNHARLLIVLGVSATMATTNNPLSLLARQQMVVERFPPSKYPQLSLSYIKDHASNNVWSHQLDKIVADHCGPNDTALLYGGRDSFLNAYTTKRFPTRELTSSRHVSGTEIRRQVSEAPRSSSDFRAGAVWSAFQRFPIAYSTVDIVPVDRSTKRVLLARKSGEIAYRFVGGFVDPSDTSFEHAAERELEEETELDIERDDLIYIGSGRVNDWRYRSEQDKILTHLYVVEPMHTDAVASDDIAEVRWFGWDEVSEKILVSEHGRLWTEFVGRIAKHLKWAAPKGTLTISVK